MRRAPPPSGDSAGLLIALEGIDGSGKTEQARRLARWLRGRSRRVTETREPTDGAWGQRYRAWARGEREASAEEVLRWFVEDRREHVGRVIRPALERGEIVVTDRYRASTLAYQAAHGVERARLHTLLAAEDTPSPDLEVWLRLPVRQALERLGSTATERYERAEFLERVTSEYARLGLAELDASASPEAVESALRSLVEPLLLRQRTGPRRAGDR